MAELQIPPLSSAWFAHVEALSRTELGVHHLHGARLSRAVTDVSHAYTRERANLEVLRHDEAVHGARLQFFLSRDLLKIHGPLAELQSVGALPAARHWRVLDLGAGLGSTSLGVARFAALRGGPTQLSVAAVDIDADALLLFEALARDLGSLPGVPMALQTHTHDLTSGTLPAGLRGPFELIVVGLALNELAAVQSEEALLARILACAELLTDDGCLVILEPALRDTSRVLQSLRDRLALRARSPYVFAPCLHHGPCPMRVRERDYCHERVPCQLPPALAQLAASAGLRERDLTYSYLTLHRQPRSLRELGAPEDALFRVVSGQLASKGKTEVWLCQPSLPTRAMRLDRQRSPDNAAFELAERGSVLRLAQAGADDGGKSTLRVGKEASVQLVQTWSEADRPQPT